MKKPQRKYPKIEEIDLNDWCSELNCSEEELRYCIKNVGTSWTCVEAFWSMNRFRIRATVDQMKLQQD